MQSRAFDHVLVIMFENQYRGYVMNNEYMRNLAARGIELTNSFGVMHPSQTNYITSIAGELCNVSDDDVPQPYLGQNTVVDLIEGAAEKLDWRAYMDSYVAGWTPWKSEGFQPIDAYPYVLKHNPFSSFQNILSSRERWQKIDNEAGFYRDLLNGTFPEYAWFTPNMWHDGHYLEGSKNNDLKGERAPILVDQQAAWLKSFFEGLNFPGPNSKLPPNTLVVVTYDEADFESDYDTSQCYKYYYDGPNHIYTVLLGDMISPGKQHEGYNHYSLLKTVEQNFNLADLGKNDRDANYFQFLWHREFDWQAWGEQPLGVVAAIAAAADDDQILVATVDLSGQLDYQTFDGNNFSQPIELAQDCAPSLAMAANQGQTLLASLTTDSQLNLHKYTLTNGWQPVDLPPLPDIQQVALVGIPNHDAFMLVYQTPEGQMTALRFEKGQWQTPQDLCCQTQGNFTLAAQGSNLLLIYQTDQSNSLACLSYNTEAFNKVTVPPGQYGGPYNNTTVDCWSPNGFSIGNFSAKPSILTPGEPEPTEDCYTAEGKLTAATLDGVIHLLHNNPNNPQLVSESFSIPGVLTPVNPVSYDPDLKTTTSNGYGTMAEAGWSEQKPLHGAMRAPNTPLASATLGDQVLVFFQDADNNLLSVYCGAY